MRRKAGLLVILSRHVRHVSCWMAHSETLFCWICGGLVKACIRTLHMAAKTDTVCVQNVQ